MMVSHAAGQVCQAAAFIVVVLGDFWTINPPFLLSYFEFHVITLIQNYDHLHTSVASHLLVNLFPPSKSISVMF